jgi:hypothetical protein
VRAKTFWPARSLAGSDSSTSTGTWTWSADTSCVECTRTASIEAAPHTPQADVVTASLRRRAVASPAPSASTTSTTL